jgi:hypothetical protein
MHSLTMAGLSVEFCFGKDLRLRCADVRVRDCVRVRKGREREGYSSNERFAKERQSCCHCLIYCIHDSQYAVLLLLFVYLYEHRCNRARDYHTGCAAELAVWSRVRTTVVHRDMPDIGVSSIFLA